MHLLNDKAQAEQVGEELVRPCTRAGVRSSSLILLNFLRYSS